MQSISWRDAHIHWSVEDHVSLSGNPIRVWIAKRTDYFILHFAKYDAS